MDDGPRARPGVDVCARVSAMETHIPGKTFHGVEDRWWAERIRTEVRQNKLCRRADCVDVYRSADRTGQISTGVRERGQIRYCVTTERCGRDGVHECVGGVTGRAGTAARDAG